MPKGYVIITEQVNDKEAMGAYARKAVQTVLAAGGNPIIAGPVDEVTEGEWHGTQTVVIEFPSVEAARAWYESPDYQAIIAERHSAANSNVIIISGFELPGG
jgi:uncharacterized protein (DUF1330 family)